jgi:hypothetical protein
VNEGASSQAGTSASASRKNGPDVAPSSSPPAPEFHVSNGDFRFNYVFVPGTHTVDLGATISAEESAAELIKRLLPEDTTVERYSNPVVILAFDEAHCLTPTETNKPTSTIFSRFSELRRALRTLQTLPLFALVLSTAGRIQTFLPSVGEDISTRIQLGELEICPPFTELGFDQMMSASGLIVAGGKTSIDQVASEKYMSMFGRPL